MTVTELFPMHGWTCSLCGATSGATDQVTALASFDRHFDLEHTPTGPTVLAFIGGVR